MNAKKKTDKKPAFNPAEASKGKEGAAKAGASGSKAFPSGQAGKKEGGIKATGFAFGKENYRLLLIGLAFIVVGFLLMIGGGSEDPNEFSYDIFNFRRLTLAPILILTGYVIEIFAIMKKPKD